MRIAPKAPKAWIEVLKALEAHNSWLEAPNVHEVWLRALEVWLLAFEA